MPVTLQSSDGTLFVVEANVATQSALIKDMLNDLGGDDMPIPLANVDAATLTKVLSFCEHHKDDHQEDKATSSTSTSTGSQSTPPVQAAPGNEPISPIKAQTMDNWDTEFFEGMSKAEVLTIILAANYLDIVLLLDQGCQIIANSIKGKKIDEIRAELGIANDFTPDEEEAIRRENEWCAELPSVSSAI